MEEIGNFQELEALKEELALLKQNLDKEKIINDELLRSVMRQKSSWINKFIKFETIILIPVYLLFVLICHLCQISQWYALVFLVLAGIDNLVDYRTYCIPSKLFSTCSMREIRDLLVRQKKERFLQLCISLPACLIWITAFGYQMIKSFHEGGVSYFFLNEGSIGGIVVGGIVGITLVLWLHRKAQRTNDTIIGEISADEIS